MPSLKLNTATLKTLASKNNKYGIELITDAEKKQILRLLNTSCWNTSVSVFREESKANDETTGRCEAKIKDSDVYIALFNESSSNYIQSKHLSPRYKILCFYKCDTSYLAVKNIELLAKKFKHASMIILKDINLSIQEQQKIANIIGKKFNNIKLIHGLAESITSDSIYINLAKAEHEPKKTGVTEFDTLFSAQSTHNPQKKDRYTLDKASKKTTCCTLI